MFSNGVGVGEKAGEVGLKEPSLTFRWQEIICEPRVRHREPWFESRRPRVERKGWRLRTSQRPRGVFSNDTAQTVVAFSSRLGAFMSSWRVLVACVL